MREWRGYTPNKSEKQVFLKDFEICGSVYGNQPHNYILVQIIMDIGCVCVYAAYGSTYSMHSLHTQIPVCFPVSLYSKNR